jgi:hypothetical protein
MIQIFAIFICMASACVPVASSLPFISLDACNSMKDRIPLPPGAVCLEMDVPRWHDPMGDR